MKKIIVLMFCFVLMLQVVSAISNPSAEFCEDEGYDYLNIKEESGEVGHCEVNGKLVNAWDYYRENKEKISNTKNILNESELRESKSKTSKEKSLIAPREKNDYRNDDLKSSEIIKAAPSSFDWRNNNGDWTTSVKNQGSCGACWAFSSVAVAETKANINLNDATYNTDISEQDTISNNNGDSDCDGGFETDAFSYMKNTGVVRETCMPYTQSNTGTMCPNGANEKLKISNYAKVSASATAIKNAISSNGPVVAYMVVCDDFNSFSGSGIYSHSGDVFYDDSCWWSDGEYDYLNWHSITIVGYNDPEQYWVIKNSWGTGWGDNGYVKISYDQTITNYENWIDAVFNDPEGDERVFFVDESYYVSGTDITTPPSLSSFTSSGYYNRSDDTLDFSVNTEPKSLKYLSSVKINDTSMNGDLQTGGIFTLSKTPADFGCSGEVDCSLTVIATDDSNKNITSNLNIKVDDLAPRVTNFTIINQNYYVRNDQNKEFTVNVSDADIYSVKINSTSLSYSNGLYRITTTPSTLGCVQEDGECNLTIVATDAIGNVNNSEYTQIYIDHIFPIINDINVSDDIIQTGTVVNVTVNVTDNINVSSVTAEGINLNKYGDLWSGNVPLNSSPLNIIATDSAGNTVENNSINYTIDNTLPTIFNTNVSTNFAKVGDLINISFNISEENLKNVSVKLNEYNATLNYTDSDYYEYHYLVNGSEDEGDVLVNITVSDEADNFAYHTENITFDLAPPNITSVHVERNIVKTNSTLFVSMNVTEGNIDVAKVNNQSIDCYGSDLEKVCNGSIIINSTNVNFEVWDLAGNYDNDNATYLSVDDILPSLNSINLSNNLTQSGTTVLLTINATDNIDIANITANNRSLSREGDIWTLNLQLYESPINIIVTDNATNVLEENLTFTIDDLPPVINGSVSYNNQTLASDIWYNNSLTINITAEDTNGIKKIEWRYSNESSWNIYSSPFNITEKIPQNRIFYRAIDNAENIALSKRLNIKIDKNAPIINEIKLNSNKTIPLESVTLFIKTTDTISGIKNLTAIINGTIYSEFELINDYYQTEIFSPNTTGVYEINFSVQDFAGNINTSNIQLEIIDEEPVIVPSLNKGSYVKNSTGVDFELFNVINGTYNTSSDPNKNLTNNEDLSIIINESFFEIYFNVTSDGTNYSVFYFNYSIDTMNPSLTINNLQSLDTLNGSFDINFECSDLEIGAKNIEIMINNNQIANLSGNVNNYVLDTFLFEDSNHNLTFVCYDFANNKNITELNITINNSLDITQDNNNGVVLFENTPISNYLEMITGINSTNLTVIMQVLKSPNITLPTTLKKELLYLNINASNKAESKVYFNLPLNILESVDISNLKMWVDHNESSTFEGPFQIYEVENDDEKYKFYFITNSYSEFLIAEEYENCDEGQITSSCICEDNVYNSGYCCSNAYQSTACNSDDGSSSSSSSSSGGGSSSGGISISPIKEDQSSVIENVSFDILKEGYEKWMYVNEGIFFNFDKQNHTLMINEIREFNITITIKSNPQIKNLSINEEWEVNLNDDQSPDILVTLLNISLDEKKALIKVKDISENIVSDVETNIIKNESINKSTFEDYEKNNESEEDKDIKNKGKYAYFIIILIILIFFIVIYYIRNIHIKRKSKSKHKRKK